jgi:hypothetical protein
MRNLSKQRWDILTLGAVAGAIGVVVKDLLELLVLFFIPSFKTCPRLAAGIILDPKILTKSILPIVGLEIDIAVSIVVGIIVVAVLSRVSWKHLFVKGLVLGLLAWTIIDITLSKLLSRLPPPNSIWQLELSLIIHLIYGLTVVGTAWVLGKKYLDIE